MLPDTLHDVDEVIVGVDVVQPAGCQQALHDADVFSAELSPTEQPVLSAHWDDAQRALKMVGIDRHLRVIEIHGEPDASLTDIGQRAKERTARQEALLFK